MPQFAPVTIATFPLALTFSVNCVPLIQCLKYGLAKINNLNFYYRLPDYINHKKYYHKESDP